MTTKATIITNEMKVELCEKGMEWIGYQMAKSAGNEKRMEYLHREMERMLEYRETLAN